MPELPEVELVRRHIEATCLGRRITKVRVLDRGILDGITPQDLDRFSKGRFLIGTKRHGKQLFLDLGKGFVTVHLGMTGDLIKLGKAERPTRHTRVVFNFEDGTKLIYDDPRKFGSIGTSSSIQRFVVQRDLGPDAMKVKRQAFVLRVKRSHRAIKSVLLDQHVIAGIGNLYADEVLYQARVHPLQLADSLSEAILKRMWHATRHALRASIEVATDFQKLPEGYLLRSRYEGRPCPRGDGAFRALKVGGRTTYYCPGCQALI